MRAGPMRNQIQIMKKNDERDASGAITPPETLFHETMAEISPLVGREYLAAAQIQANITHRVRIRFFAGITPNMAVVFGARRLEIVSVQNVNERNAETVLMCYERIKG